MPILPFFPRTTATWDTPPSPSDKLEHEGLAKAFKRYLKGRSVEIPVLRRDEEARRDSRSATDFRNFEKQPDCIVGGVSRRYDDDARGEVL